MARQRGQDESAEGSVTVKTEEDEGLQENMSSGRRGGGRRNEGRRESEKHRLKHLDQIAYFKQVNALLEESELSTSSLVVEQVLEEIKNKEWGLAADQRCSKVIERILGLLVRVAGGFDDNEGAESAIIDDSKQSRHEERAASRRTKRMCAVRNFCEFMGRLAPRAKKLATNFYASHVLQTVLEHVPAMIGIEARLGGESQEHDRVEREEDTTETPEGVEDSFLLLWENLAGDSAEPLRLASDPCGTHVARSLVKTLAGIAPTARHHLELGRRNDAKTPWTVAVLHVPQSFLDCLERVAGATADRLSEEPLDMSFILGPHSSPFIQELLRSLHAQAKQPAIAEALSRLIEALCGLQEARKEISPIGCVRKSHSDRSSQAVDSGEHDGSPMQGSRTRLLKIAESLVKSPTGSRLLEAVIEVMSLDAFHILLTRWGGPNLPRIAAAPLGNYVAQKLLASKHLSAQHLDLIVKDLDVAPLLNGNGRAVLWKLCEAAARVRSCGGRILSAVLKHLGISQSRDYRLGWLCLLSLRPMSEVMNALESEEGNDAEEGDDASSKTKKPTLNIVPYGCSVVESALKFPPADITPLTQGFRSFTNSRSDILVNIAKSQSGSRLIEAILRPESAIDMKMAGRLCRAYFGHFSDLAFDPYGSYVVIGCYRSATMDVKKRIANELLERYEALRIANLRLFRLCSLEEYKKHKDEWLSKQEGKSKARKHLSDIIAPLPPREADNEDLQALEILAKRESKRKRKNFRASDAEKESKSGRLQAAAADAHNEDPLFAATLAAIEGATLKVETRKKKKRRKRELVRVLSASHFRVRQLFRMLSCPNPRKKP